MTSEITSEARASSSAPLKDSFPLFALCMAAAVWIVAVLPMAYDPVALGLAILILPIAAFLWLVVFGVILFRRQWMRALSLVLALLAIGAAVPLTVHFQDEICFWTLSPYYFAKVAQLQPDGDGVRRATFSWKGTLWWNTQLQYDESDSIVDLDQRAGDAYRSGHSIIRLYGHFYLDTSLPF